MLTETIFLFDSTLYLEPISFRSKKSIFFGCGKACTEQTASLQGRNLSWNCAVSNCIYCKVGFLGCHETQNFEHLNSRGLAFLVAICAKLLWSPKRQSWYIQKFSQTLEFFTFYHKKRLSVRKTKLSTRRTVLLKLKSFYSPLLFHSFAFCSILGTV